MIKRYIAHVTLEADTPLKIGSSANDFLQDSPIQRDWNELPMILGTSLSGVLRKEFDGDVDEIFGDEKGSKVIFSNALLLDENQQVQEGLLLNKSAFLQLFDDLPIREHTAITAKGVAKDQSKFDEEVVYKGSRFKFSIEMLDEMDAFEKLLAMLQCSSFRIGGGSTKGFGKFKVLEVVTTTVETPEELAKHSSSLNHTLTTKVDLSTTPSQKHIAYRLVIKADDFFMFGSGFGDEDTDQTPVYEKVIDYQTKGLSAKKIVIPASSIKGALAHRTVYHYNLQNGHYIGSGYEPREVIAELFGEAKDSKKSIKASKGKVLFSDLYQEDRNETKTFDHVAIDRFTSGAIDGALFQEKTIAQEDVWEVEILVEKGVDEAFLKAFEAALEDVTTGMLPLGGATTKGHGVFTGELLKDGEILNVRK